MSAADTNLQSKTTSFDLESNPFERSFATKDGSTGQQDHGRQEQQHQQDAQQNGSIHHQHLDDSHSGAGAEAAASHKEAASHASAGASSNNKLPRITPPLFTPGGRRLHPLGLLPGHMPPETPGSNLWNSLLNVTSNGPGNTGQNNANGASGTVGEEGAQGSHFGQFVNTLRKTGLTPNELNLRSGLTPGGFPFAQLPGLTTPSGLLNGPMTPGLQSLLGIDLQHQMQSQPQQAVADVAPAQDTAELQAPLTEQPRKTEAPALSRPAAESSQPTASQPVAPRPTAKKASVSGSSNTTNESDKHEVSDKKRKAEPTRRRTKLRKVKQEDDLPVEGDSESPEDGSKAPLLEEEKRKNFLERNRVAASKCRQRKKQLIQKMEDELTFYLTGYREMLAHVAQLRDALLGLLHAVEPHKDTVPAMLLDQCRFVLDASNLGTVASIPSTVPTTLPSVPVAQPPAPAPMAQQDIQQGQQSQQSQQGQQGQQGQHMPQHIPQHIPQQHIPQHSAQGQIPQGGHMGSQGQHMGAQTHGVGRHYAPVYEEAMDGGQLQELPPGTQGMEGNGELRAIHSMSNIAGMQQQQQLQQAPVQMNGYQLRNANSMVDLQSYQGQFEQPARHGAPKLLT